MPYRLPSVRTLCCSAAVALLASAASVATASAKSPDGADAADEARSISSAPSQRKEKKKLEQATFANGCFWCTEAVFEQLKGVESAVSGYTGGHIIDPTYKEVCTGATGHAEALQVTYDPAVISFSELLEVFWKTHDPTTLNQQGPDIGTQYRSGVFYHNDQQRKEAEHYKAKLEEARVFNAPIVTEITKFKTFYPAEDDHQGYFALNPNQGYCRAVIVPKVNKFRKAFADKLKDPKEKK